MKFFLKGIGLGLSLNIANRFCELAFEYNETIMVLFSAVIFCMITTAFLVSDKIQNLFICGFTGLFSMFLFEIFLFQGIASSSFYWLIIYVNGMYGSIVAVPIATILTTQKFRLTNYLIRDEISMTKQLKTKLILYAIISAISFSYLVLPENAGISVPIFSVIQFLCLWYTVPKRKKLFLFIPIFLLSLNNFISANTIWQISNFLISGILYGCMFLDFDFKKDSFKFISNAITRIASAFPLFPLPFKWILEFHSEKAPIVKRIAIAIAIAIPCTAALVLVLSNADMVFSLQTKGFFDHISTFIRLNAFLKGICGILVGLFLFGLLYRAHTATQEEKAILNHYKVDLLIINILLVSILFVYTLFVIIQFRYLFAGATLPNGLTYTQYARKGFFELLALTGVNIGIILAVTKYTKHYQGSWRTFTKILCHYLCAVTIVLLVSSFYRMMLYTNDDGLTRLRFFVLGFLVFEAIGLLITFFYIAKPRFNLALVYTTIALVYYILLNIIPTDNIIAKNQIDKYLNGERTDIEYIFTLSADAVPALEYLSNNTDDELLKNKVQEFIREETSSIIPDRWQRYNLSIEHAKKSIK